MKKEDNSSKNNNNHSLSEDRKKKELTFEEVKDLPLIDNDFFLFAVDNNKELANVLIRPALNYLGIKNYQTAQEDPAVLAL